MDHHIGQLIDLLDELKIAENTLVVFVSDNGGCVMEGDAPGGRYPANNGPLRGSKASTYQGGLNVPFLMHWKGQIPEGTVSSEQVMHADIFATLLDAASIPVPKMNGKNPVRGLSLMPHMLSAGKESIPERTMIFDLWGNIGLRKGDYKLWGDVGRDATPDWQALIADIKAADLALYDLSQDVSEQNDLRSEKPEVYTSLKTELIDYFSGIDDEYPVPEASGDTPEAKAPDAKPRAMIPEKFFKSRDKNGDGALSLREYTQKPVEEAPARTKIFQRLDTDGDGQLTLEEVTKGAK